MTIHDGRGNIKRRHAHNYIGEQANKRLQEIVQSAQGRELNALKVDSFEVLYYRRVDNSVRCTCQYVAAPGKEHSLVNPASIIEAEGIGNDDVTMSFGDEEITLDHTAPIFGTRNTAGMYEDLDSTTGSSARPIDDEEIVEDDDEGRSSARLHAEGPECGICYRNGLVPSYELYGHDRQVFATHNINDSYGYTINKVASPHAFEQTDPVGFVDFTVQIPKYYKSVRFSVRDNITHLADEPIFMPSDRMLTIADQDFRLFRGSTLTVRVRAPRFTHLVVDFDLGVEPVLAALSQDQRATDWTMFDTLGTISMVLPMTVAQVNTSDVLHVVKRGLSFKITDVSYLRTASQRNMDWQVQARVLQPQEGLRNIYKASKLL